VGSWRPNPESHHSFCRLADLGATAKPEATKELAEEGQRNVLKRSSGEPDPISLAVGWYEHDAICEHLRDRGTSYRLAAKFNRAFRCPLGPAEEIGKFVLPHTRETSDTQYLALSQVDVELLDSFPGDVSSP
jgi:hypothetical protein